MASMESGEGLGLGPERTLPTFPASVLVILGLCSLTGGGVRGERGGGEGRGDRALVVGGEGEAGEGDLGLRCSSSLRLSSASSSRLLLLASSVTKWSGTELTPSIESSDFGDSERSGGGQMGAGGGGGGVAASGSGRRARAER